MQEKADLFISKLTTVIIDPIIYLIIGIAFLYFIWGLVIFISNSDDPNQRKEGWNHIIWGIVGIIIMFSVWGILNLINGTVNSVL